MVRRGGRSRGSGSTLFLVLAGVVQVACGAGAEPGPERRPAVDGRPIVLVGLDGADWLRIDPWVEAGRLPTFARLKQVGRTGTLLSTPPLVSPIVWTTIATGRPPQDHGVLDFMVDLPGGGQAPVSSLQRLVPALWNFFSDAGRTVAVVGWWATWPAETVRGTVVSDRVAPQLVRAEATLDSAAVAPAEALAGIQALLVPAERLTLEDLTAYVPATKAEHAAAIAASRSGSRFYDDPVAHLAAVVASTRTYSAVAEALLRERRPDFLAVYLEGIDTLSHRFIRDRRRGAGAIEGAYRDADALLARLARASRPETLIVVCSDHGFHPPDAGVAADPGELTGPATAWHRPYGIVAVAEAGALAGDGARSSGPRDLGAVAPVDIAPTVLHAAGLPVAAEMPGRVVTEMLPPEAAARAVQRRPTPAWSAPAKPATSAPADEDAVARLKALGYVGAQPTSLAHLNLGEVLYRAGKLGGAERALRTAVETQPQNLGAHLWLAKALRDQGKSREALRVYRQALRLPGSAGEALVEATELAVSAGSPAEADTLLALAVAAPKPSAADRAARHTARAVLVRRDRPAEAERELRAALLADPLSFDALSRLFDLLVSVNRARELLPLAREAAARASGSPRHQALLGEAWLARGEASQAEAAFRGALTLAPDAVPVRLDLARAQLALGKPDEARATLAACPASMERSLLLGAAYSAQRDWSAAAGELEAALGRGSPTPALLNGLAWARHQLGQEAEAAALLRRSLELDGRQPEIRRLLAEVESKARQP